MEKTKDLEKRAKLTRFLSARSYSFSSKTGIKRLQKNKVLARRLSKMPLKDEITPFEAIRLWEDYGHIVLKNTRRNALISSKELIGTKIRKTAEETPKLVAILGTKETEGRKEYLTVRKVKNKNKDFKSWESFPKRNGFHESAEFRAFYGEFLKYKESLKTKAESKCISCLICKSLEIEKSDTNQSDTLSSRIKNFIAIDKKIIEKTIIKDDRKVKDVHKVKKQPKISEILQQKNIKLTQKNVFLRENKNSKNKIQIGKILVANPSSKTDSNPNNFRFRVQKDQISNLVASAACFPYVSSTLVFRTVVRICAGCVNLRDVFDSLIEQHKQERLVSSFFSSLQKRKNVTLNTFIFYFRYNRKLYLQRNEQNAITNFIEIDRQEKCEFSDRISMLTSVGICLLAKFLSEILLQRMKADENKDLDENVGKETDPNNPNLEGLNPKGLNPKGLGRKKAFSDELSKRFEVFIEIYARGIVVLMGEDYEESMKEAEFFLKSDSDENELEKFVCREKLKREKLEIVSKF